MKFYTDDKGRKRPIDGEIKHAVDSLSTQEYMEADRHFTFTEQDKADMMMDIDRLSTEGKLKPEEYREMLSDVERINVMPLADRVAVVKKIRDAVESNDKA
ncbi:MAG: hypothetical protein JRN26_00960 [Nitrososphaerota archaeon]|jgi:hypothetical protein|nr:hypothetical protein [Nitrososphaerota archaeon]MDG6928243.1 hypothetical protein [Nitrososphaerota archaeon]MDG6930737.1 hypothetical protein [Nitrososphaerota archaeon]MDG6931827.1 hypothetical protein [Nitrososphaerota archaeon]MDG6935449.1 hypothetical protein [Nitrososphaerota archaeon]